jgi:RNA polymerase sigma factor (sigma-70 family)
VRQDFEPATTPLRRAVRPRAVLWEPYPRSRHRRGDSPRRHPGATNERAEGAQTEQERVEPATEESDQDLVGRARAGDVEAYGRLVSRYQWVVVRAALFAGAGDNAEDAAQDAFVAAWQALPRFADGAAFRPWIVTIVTNGVRNRHRSQRRREAILERYWAAANEPIGDTSVDAAMAGDTRQLLLTAISRLPVRHQTVVAYRYLLQLSEAETATALGWPVGTVKSSLSRAMTRLRRDHSLDGLLGSQP